MTLSIVLLVALAAQDAAPATAKQLESETKKALRSKTEADRIAAVLRVDAFVGANPAAATPGLLRLMATALGDSDLSVRTAAAHSLSLRFGSEDAAAVLAKSVRSVQKEIALLYKNVGKGSPSISTRQVAGRSLPGGVAGEVHDYAAAVLNGLGRRPCATAVDGLGQFTRTPNEHLSGLLIEITFQNLARHGNAEAFAVAVQWLRRLERDFDFAAESKGGSGIVSSSSMKRSEVFRQQFPAPDGRSFDAVQSALAAAADRAQVSSIAPSVLLRESWEDWLKAVEDELPEVSRAAEPDSATADEVADDKEDDGGL